MADKNLTNTPADLSKVDHFSTRYKGDFIATYLNSYYFQNPPLLNINKMIALYGSWGSGKTSVVDYIRKKLKSDYFEILFFEAWRFEKDTNLPLSLLDMMMEHYKNKKKSACIEDVKDLMSVARKKLNHFGKGISLNLMGMGIDFSKVAEAEEGEETSFYKLDEEFKTKYLSLEKKFLENPDNAASKKVIVFIDDLDRCDPENVLDLLSAIKLFFTLGESTIFFCALDKKAVCQAVQHRYGNVISGEEYLEKIFDINFNMPESNNIETFIREYLFEEVGTDERKALVTEFFHAIDFEVPRKIKKVLLKYFSIKEIRKSLFDQRRQIHEKSVTPRSEEMFSDHIKEYSKELDIYFGERSDNIVFLLFYIVLFEFYRSDYDKILNLTHTIDPDAILQIRAAIVNNNASFEGGSIYDIFTIIMMNLDPLKRPKGIQDVQYIKFINKYDQEYNSILLKFLVFVVKNSNTLKSFPFNYKHLKKLADMM